MRAILLAAPIVVFIGPSIAAAEIVSTSSTATNAAELEEIERALAGDSSPPAAAPSEEPARFNAQSLLPDISLTLDAALAAFSEDENYQTGGHDPTASGFHLQQLELAFTGKVDPYLRLDGNLVFGLFGVELEEAYATTLDLPWALQARFGQFLTRFGRQNPTHLHAWHFVDQPFPLGRVFGGEGNRNLGVELSVLAPLDWYVEIVGSVTSATGEGTARSFFGAEDLGVGGPLDFQFTGAIKQFFPLSEDLSLFFGLSAASGPNSTGRSNRTDIYGADLYLKFRPITYASDLILSLESEWFYRRRQVPGDLLQDWSGFAQLFFRFAKRWGAAARWELGTPASSENETIDYLDPDWTSSRQRVSTNLTFWPTEFSRFRLQGSVDLPRWKEEPIWALFLAAEVTIGAHGAHKF